MKKFFALTFCLMLALVIAGCCSTCPAKKGCDSSKSCPSSENCRQLSCPKNGCEATTARCRRTSAACKSASAQCAEKKCAPACAKCCDRTDCASCCRGGVCSKGKCTAPAANCRKGSCAAKPQICPMKPKASMSLNWKLDLSSLQGVQADAAKPDKDIVLGFDFAKRRCFGVSGVNRYFGPITVNPKEGKLSFGQLGSTMMMGPGLKYEQAYLKMLSTVDGCHLDNGRLVLTSKGKVVARYSPIDKIN